MIIIGKGINKSLLENFIQDHKLGNKIKLIGYKKNPYPYLKNPILYYLAQNTASNVLLEAQFLKNILYQLIVLLGPGKYFLMVNGDLVNIGDYKKIAYLINTYKKRKIINYKIKIGYNNFYRFDYDLNCKNI